MPLVSCPRFRHRGGDLPGGGLSPSASTLALRLPQQKTSCDGDGGGCTHAPVTQPSEWPSWIDYLVAAWCYWFAGHSPSFHQFVAAVAFGSPLLLPRICGSIDTQDYNNSKFTQDPAHARDRAEAGAARSSRCGVNPSQRGENGGMRVMRAGASSDRNCSSHI
ncbi:uncharacterized protein [Triticum aestivum]|uniref:uncharacterized protein n=1 Tax=Triticum aestivum TaxID=4565 RepID=UPI001D0294D9|nr:uncharacterized protein LOC123147941 [Triticum aestivum]